MIRPALYKGLATLSALVLLSTLQPSTLTAQPLIPDTLQIAKGDENEVLPNLAEPSWFKLKDAPNPLDYKRLRQRENLLVQGSVATAAALAKTGKDKVLVILVEFGGTDTASWNPGDSWDPIGNPEKAEHRQYGDCSSVITQTQTFTYTGPLHNQIPQPASRDHPGYDALWTADFSREHYRNMLFGDGLYIQYTMANDEGVTIDLRGYTLKSYYEEQSKGLYTVEGEVIGWVQVPHSEAWYGADQCPGARSADYSGLADGFFPKGGNPRSLVKDAIDACVAAYPDFNWAEYDQNGDGVLDRLMIVHAGLGEEDSPALLKESGVGEHAIWSHSSLVWPFYDIGNTGLKVGPYTMMPENGNLGVFAHEFAHSLGAIDLYAYLHGETSAGLWTLMADEWGGGWPSGAVPPGLDPWHKYLLGWNDPFVLNTMSPEIEVTIGQACHPPTGTEDSVVINLPPQIERVVSPYDGHYMWWAGQENYLDARLSLAAPLDLTNVTTAILTFKTFYQIEIGWDFGFVQVSTDGGLTWTSLPDVTTTDAYNPGCLFIDEQPGYTGFSGGWLSKSVDLSSYAGQSHVLLRFRYETDWAVPGMGWFLDGISITADGRGIFSDNAESLDKRWIAEGWTRTDGYQTHPHYYIAEWRNACGFDAGLASGRYNIKDFGMLLWYRNLKYTDNEIFSRLADGPAFGPKGACLVVDAHFEPWRSSTSEYVNEVANLHSRVQMRDACFGLRDTQPFHISERWRKGNPDEEFGFRPAVFAFHDSLGWYPGLEYAPLGPNDLRMQWITKQWDSSCVVPARDHYGVAPPEYPLGEPVHYGGEEYSDGSSTWQWWYPDGLGYAGTAGNPGEHCYGVHIEVVKEAADLSWGQLRIWNDTDTFLGWIKVDKTQAAPGDVLTYVVYIKDAASNSALSTVDISIPKGTAFVEGSLSGAQYVADRTGPPLGGRGRIVWQGLAGGKALHTADAHITYQVRIDPGARCGIENEALVTVGNKSYKLSAITQLPCVYLPWVSKTM